MTICTDYCNKVVTALQPLSPQMNIVVAHESTVKDVPIHKIIAAVGVKKCVIADMPAVTVDDSVKIETRSRKMLITVGINIYVPYHSGSKACIGAFDSIFDTILNAMEPDLNEVKLLSTKYSRETQSLVSETEFVFEVLHLGAAVTEDSIVFG